MKTEIVDYKICGHDELTTYQQQYENQVRNYMRIMPGLGLSYKNIKGALYYPLQSLFHEISTVLNA